MRVGATDADVLPVVELCRAGRLFEVQDWIRSGGPIVFPQQTDPRRARQNPLYVAIDRGFYSLAQVLLDAGAPIRVGRWSALEQAVNDRYTDMVELLIRHGANVSELSMRIVLQQNDLDMAKLFIAQGADVTYGNPVAWALVNKMRVALTLVKERGANEPDLIRQANIALRHHASEGHARWVALLLWAGADPWSRGRYWIAGIDSKQGDDEDEEEERRESELPSATSNAVELALRRGRLEILKLKGMSFAPGEDASIALCPLEMACESASRDTVATVALMLKRGYCPRRHLSRRGTGAIDGLLSGMAMAGRSAWSHSERFAVLRLLVANGAAWMPSSRSNIANTRRLFLRMERETLIAFVRIMHDGTAASRSDMEELTRTEAVASLLGDKLKFVRRLISYLPAKLPEEG